MMDLLRTGRHRWWQALTLPGGVLAVHQLRYLLAYGSGAARELSSHGDRYVATAVAIAVVLLAIASCALAGRVVAARRGLQRTADRGPDSDHPAPWLVWLRLSTVLVIGFVALELVEIALEPQHPGGISGVFGDGGWWALPASLGVAALLTLVRGGARRLIELAARCRHARRALGSARPRPLLSRADPAPLASPLASCAAGRAPPARA